ncbi:MAG: pectinacetylesterase family protein [Gammaproteobacteria bacterium]|nr:pectinacetylesterase family protein [Gammaproteobacteria bacterium]NND38409.1 hypothetical protein [Pseudomonadales bacterium]RZV58836.1 MAG: hypothetical protein EX270_02250 [Pseudomonadales bacterium]
MQTIIKAAHILRATAVSLGISLFVYSSANAAPSGLNANALQELKDADVDGYLGQYSPTGEPQDLGGGWSKHDFDSDNGNGPICIDGSDFSVVSKEGNPKKLLVFLQGGGACWQGFYNCNTSAQNQANSPPQFGVFDTSQSDNPFADYSVVYVPYCDGSAFGGDNEVDDPTWTNISGSPKRYHRGVRNQSAGIDLAGQLFPKAKQITVMGHSAGGVGVAAFAPFLARFVFGNNVKLTVFNDAGPIAVNLGAGTPPFACQDFSCLSVAARAFDWNFASYYPQSCIDDGRCNEYAQQTGIISWRLENDSTIREAFYETDADGTNRFFAQGDGSLMSVETYRALILQEHGALNALYPKRYKRFIVSEDDTHGGIQGTAGSACFPPQPFLFYTQEVNGKTLRDWTEEFVRIGQRQSKFGWKDIVEDFTELNCLP